MMGRQSRQMAMIFVDMESLIPENHLLRKVDRMVSFDFIYDLLAPYYPATGRPSVDPVSMFKMLLIGYLYGIKSERRLVEEVQLNIAYRWFCGFELDDAVPDHSTFSKTRTRNVHVITGTNCFFCSSILLRSSSVMVCLICLMAVVWSTDWMCMVTISLDSISRKSFRSWSERSDAVICR